MFSPPNEDELSLDSLALLSNISSSEYQDPQSWAEMLRRSDVERDLYLDAAREEVEFGFENNIYKVRHRDSYKGKVLGNKWVLHMKFHAGTGKMKRARSRLTIRGDQQIEGLHYDRYDLYSPVASRSSVFILLSMAVQHSLHLTKVDITKAFNLGKLGDQEICMEVPQGYRDNAKYAPFGRDTIWEVMVATYGLKQAASAYYRRFAEVMLSKGYRRLSTDASFFCKGELGTDRYIAFPIHVDDKLVAYASQADLDMFMSDLKEAGFIAKQEGYEEILGMHCKYDREQGVCELSQRTMILDCLKKHGLEKRVQRTSPCTPESCKALQSAPIPTPAEFCPARYSRFRSILGTISYIKECTKPELMFAVSLISQYMSNPGDEHMLFLENMLLYLKGVADIPFKFTRQTDPNQDVAVMFFDASLGNRDARRSQTCWLAFLYGNLVGWNSRYQPSVALSVTESEFMALSAAGQFACWLQREINELGIHNLSPIKIFCDNQSAIHIAHNPLFNKYTKHIDLRFEWIKQAVQRNIIKPLFKRTAGNYSDIGTKSLHKQHFISFMKVLCGHVQIVLDNDCDEFDAKVIESAGIQMPGISLATLVWNSTDQCYAPASCYQPSA